ncbi:MAG: hypothetical protein ABSH20_10015 [Tepidisphaeraceae bacterium]
MTFLVWSDQHVKVDGQCVHLDAAVEAMNKLAGREYPPEFGGRVAWPAFVLGCGDCTDWPTPAATHAYANIVTRRLKLPSFDIMGNHDEGDDPADRAAFRRRTMLAAVVAAIAAGGLAYRLAGGWSRLRRTAIRLPVAFVMGLAAGAAVVVVFMPADEAMRDWIVSRHGAVSYSFDRGGVHFVAACSEYNARQRITPEALAFIRRDLAAVPRDRPVVLAMHYCLEAISNKDELIESFGDANVVLVLGGHYHVGSLKEYRGVPFIQVPSPTARSQFVVVRIADGRLAAAAYDYGLKEWSQHPVGHLNVSLQGRGSGTSTRPGHSILSPNADNTGNH